MNEQEQEMEEGHDPSNLPINRNNVKFREAEYYIEDDNCNNMNEENEYNNEYNGENDENMEEVEYDMNNFNNNQHQEHQDNIQGEEDQGEINYEEIFGDNIEEYLDDKDKEDK